MSMFNINRNRCGVSRERNAGTVLLTAIIFTVLLAVTTASTLKWVSTESRLNASHQLHLEATNAAEVMLQFGAAELQMKWSNSNTINSPSEQLRMSTFSNLFPGSPVNLTNLELTRGNLSAGEYRYLHPRQGVHFSDPMRGHWVFSRDVKLYAKATASHNVLGSKDVYVSQTFSVRETSLLAYMVFYNMDLEFSPRQPFRIVGPVHANGDIYLQAKDSGSLNFTSTLHAPNIFTKSKKTTVWEDNLVTAENAISGSQKFFSKTGKTSINSEQNDWYTVANKRWSGAVKSGSHNVQPLPLINVKKYEETYSVGTGINLGAKNHPYALIEPQLDKVSRFYKGDKIAGQKFSRFAGLVFKITLKTPYPYLRGPYEIKAYTYEKDSTGKVRLNADETPRLKEVDLSRINIPHSFGANGLIRDTGTGGPLR